ncbi:MAG: MipA/OmpV family protein [Rhodanobacter sp.]
MNRLTSTLSSRLWLSACVLVSLAWTQASVAASDPTTLTGGVGMEHLPNWLGAKAEQYRPIPYIDIDVPNRLSLSTQSGLQVDLIGGTVLHGGIYGDYRWGRDSDDLGPLRHRVSPLSPRLTLGGYLEWQLNKNIDVGSDLSHDTSGAGAYFNVYAEWDLPQVGLLQHSFQLRWEAMNAHAMNRFFGITPSQAAALNVPAWQPGAGSEFASLEYDLFLPTSQHTGFALALSYGRLLGSAGDSPLVTQFGSRTQLSESLAFVYHR